MPQTTPTVVMPIPYNSTAINVTWTAVEETREKIRGELLGYRVCKTIKGLSEHLLVIPLVKN